MRNDMKRAPALAIVFSAATALAQGGSSRQPDPMETVAAAAGPLRLQKIWPVKAGGQWLEASFDFIKPGQPALDPRLRSDYDVKLMCELSLGVQIKKNPGCGKKAVMVGDRPICFHPQEKSGPGGAKPYGASTSWTGMGDCHLDFKHGVISGETGKADAVKATAALADWMDRVLGGSATADELRANRKTLEAAVASRARQ